jgi:S1-C subfamily serine protease
MEGSQEMSKELIPLIRPGIVRLAFFKDRDQVGSATGFLSNGFLVTCSHVIRQYPFDAVDITFGDQNLKSIAPIRLSFDTLTKNIVKESLESEYDYALIWFSEPEANGRYQLQFKTVKQELVGEQVLFFGFPFGTQHLTSHIGYISSDFWRGSAHLFQIDGSINPGNSGGPLIHIPSGSVIGIVTRTETGLEKDFDQLVEAVRSNVKALESRQGGARIVIGGIDPIASMQITMRILAKLSFNMKRGANVGIGFCLSSEHITQTGLIKEAV